MSEANIEFQFDAGQRLGVIELTRPQAHNAINWQSVEELDSITERVLQLDQAREIDCVLLTAQGKNFCVGGDVSVFPEEPAEATPRIQAMATIAHRSTLRLDQLTIPIVTRVQGAVAGAGVGFVVGSDIAIAEEGASFTLAFAGVGVTPDGGTSWNLPRAVGYRRAMDLLLTNRRVDSEEAEQVGLLSRVVTAEALDGEVERTVAAILELGPQVGRATKRLLKASAQNSLAAHLADEASSMSHLAAGPIAQGRLAAFRKR